MTEKAASRHSAKNAPPSQEPTGAPRARHEFLPAAIGVSLLLVVLPLTIWLFYGLWVIFFSAVSRLVSFVIVFIASLFGMGP